MSPQFLQSLFEQRRVILATMHRKEEAIAPLIEPALGVKVQVPAHFNTDVFGTFTREVDRPGTQLEAARLKALKALEITGESLAIASEGTFGPHPLFPYLPCNRELVILIDLKHDLEVVGEEFSTTTNYSHQRVSSLAEAEHFAHKAGFPQHGLVVIPDPQTPGSGTGNGKMFKGITSKEALQEAVTFALQTSPQVHLETDMRALYNPTRMQTIAKATQNLIQKLNQFCPQCGWPGFDLLKSEPGLPCGWCGAPTSLIQTEIYGCKKCDFTQEVHFPEGIETADPGQCAYCNP